MKENKEGDREIERQRENLTERGREGMDTVFDVDSHITTDWQRWRTEKIKAKTNKKEHK